VSRSSTHGVGPRPSLSIGFGTATFGISQTPCVLSFAPRPRHPGDWSG
jgi:hypothetical protein